MKTSNILFSLFFRGSCILGIFLFSGIFSACSLRETANKAPETTQETSTEEEFTNETIPEVNQMDIARRRVALRTIIRKGDYFQVKNDAEQAVIYYEQAHAQIQDDPKVAIRLANAYLDLKQFRKAADIFIKLDIRQFDEASKQKIIASIMLDDTRDNRKSLIESIPFLPETKEYLIILDECSQKPHSCLDTLQKKESKSIQVQSLKNTLKNASSTSQDTIFPEALVLGKLYEQKAYLAVKKLGDTILARRPDYRVIMKITGYADYELGKYSDAAALLEKYYTSKTDDVEVAYMLGIINFYKNDYATSNLYFNTAVLNGYTPKEELERRLIYNYILLSDVKGAFKVFRYLLDSPKVTAEDYQVALFIANETGEHSKEFLWSQKGLQKFPNNAYILAFAAGVARRNEDHDIAFVHLQNAKNAEPNNPLVSLEYCREFIVKKYYLDAKIWCEKTKENDSGDFFSKQADILLESLKRLDTPTGTGEVTSLDAVSVFKEGQPSPETTLSPTINSVEEVQNYQAPNAPVHSVNN